MAETKQEADVLYYANDNVLRLTGVSNALTGEYLNGLSTVTVTLMDTSGTEVSGETWPKVLGYVTDSDGEYRGILPYDLVLSPNTTYYAEISVNGGDDLRGAWRRHVRVIRRR